MKKIFLITLLALLCHVMQASDYLRFAEEGKVWHMQYSLPAPIYGQYSTEYYYDYFVKGDTVVGNRPCKKLYSFNHSNSGKTELRMVIFEENRKVYSMVGTQPKLIFDFGAEVGDEIEIEDESNTTTTYYVHEVKQVMINGISRRAIGISTEADFGPWGWWVEGIGTVPCMEAPYFTLIDIVGNTTSLNSCELKGKLIWFKSDLAIVWGNSQPSINADVNSDGVVDIDDVNLVIKTMLHK